MYLTPESCTDKSCTLSESLLLSVRITRPKEGLGIGTQCGYRNPWDQTKSCTLCESLREGLGNGICTNTETPVTSDAYNCFVSVIRR